MNKPNSGYSKTNYIQDLIKFYSVKDKNSVENLFSQNNPKQGRCTGFYKNGILKVTNHQCSGCGKFVHPGQCFSDLHLNQFRTKNGHSMRPDGIEVLQNKSNRHSIILFGTKTYQKNTDVDLLKKNEEKHTACRFE